MERDSEETDLVGTEHVFVEDLHCNLVDEGVRDPSTVVAIRDLAEFVRANLVHGDLIGLRIILDRDLRGHAAHCGNASPVDG